MAINEFRFLSVYLSPQFFVSSDCMQYALSLCAARYLLICNIVLSLHQIFGQHLIFKNWILIYSYFGKDVLDHGGL